MNKSTPDYEGLMLSGLHLSIKHILEKADWNVFKSKATIEKSLEVRALLINAKKKCERMIHDIQEPTTTDQADAQQVGPEAEGE